MRIYVSGSACARVCGSEAARESKRAGETTTAKVGQRVGQPEHTGVVAEGGRREGGREGGRAGR